MPNEDRFKATVVQTIAKRAAFMCSNPDCRASTSGPTDKPDGSSNVGVAAHIFGANPGSARFDPEMNATARSDIANAIWLCGNCHKMIDDDPTHYPAGLLFEWLNEHEAYAREILGKTGGQLRRRYEDRHLEEFGKLSFLAERLIRDKDVAWEYRLTGEVLRYELSSVLERWSALERGLYTKPSTLIAKQDTFRWISVKTTEIQRIAGALSSIFNGEFQRSWGEPGIAGDDRLIVSTCRLFAEVCERALEWEESVRFAYVDDMFQEVIDLYHGVAGIMIEEAKRVPAFFGEEFEAVLHQATASDGSSPIVHKLEMDFELPERWADRVEEALGRAAEEYQAEIALGI